MGMATSRAKAKPLSALSLLLDGLRAFEECLQGANDLMRVVPASEKDGVVAWRRGVVALRIAFGAANEQRACNRRSLGFNRPRGRVEAVELHVGLGVGDKALSLEPGQSVERLRNRLGAHLHFRLAF